MMSSNGYSRGVPPTTQNCNSYPLLNTGNGNFDRQDMTWGLVVDREFGGCRCSDEQEMEFTPNADTYTDNTWACRCLNSDLYLNMPDSKYQCTINGVHQSFTNNKLGCVNVGEVIRLNDKNGKKCGIV